MVSHRHQVLRLYRSILTLHKTKLEPRMRILGDQYVRDEFKRHKNAAPKFVSLFLQEWKQYEAMMQQKQSLFGQELSTADRALLDQGQREKLQSLEQAAKLVGETIS